MYVLDDQEVEEAEKERLRKKLQAKKQLSPEDEAIREQQALVTAKNKYWAPILLLYPLGPVCIALTTVVFGGVITNAASTTCNAHLDTFLQGAVGLSYVLILFYAYCWIGPRPIRRLRVLKVFYSIYGVLCVGWWGFFGTLQAVTATATGFQSCLSQSPMLYLFSQYQVAVFWILFGFFLCFAGKEMHAYYKTTDEGRKASAAAKEAKEAAAAEKAARIQAEKDAAEAREKEAQAAMQQTKEERDRLYAGADDDAEEDAATADGQDHVGDDHEEEEEEEEEEEDEEGGGEGEGEEDEAAGDDDDRANNASQEDADRPETAPAENKALV